MSDEIVFARSLIAASVVGWILVLLFYGLIVLENRRLRAVVARSYVQLEKLDLQARVARRPLPSLFDADEETPPAVEVAPQARDSGVRLQ